MFHETECDNNVKNKKKNNETDIIETKNNNSIVTDTIETENSDNVVNEDITKNSDNIVNEDTSNTNNDGDSIIKQNKDSVIKQDNKSVIKQDSDKRKVVIKAPPKAQNTKPVDNKPNWIDIETQESSSSNDWQHVKNAKKQPKAKQQRRECLDVVQFDALRESKDIVLLKWEGNPIECEIPPNIKDFAGIRFISFHINFVYFYRHKEQNRYYLLCDDVIDGEYHSVYEIDNIGNIVRAKILSTNLDLRWRFVKKL
jgi:hypothetical protein